MPRARKELTALAACHFGVRARVHRQHFVFAGAKLAFKSSTTWRKKTKHQGPRYGWTFWHTAIYLTLLGPLLTCDLTRLGN